MGVLPQEVYDLVLSLDKKETIKRKEEQERIEAVLSKEKVPEIIDDFIHTSIQAYHFQQVDNGFLMAVRPMNRTEVQTFLFENATILENEFRVNPGSVLFLQYGEAYDIGNEYEVHLLFWPFFFSGDEADLEYLTLRCSGIRESDSREAIVREHYSEDKRYNYGISMSNGYYVPWFKELYRIDEEHTVYAGRMICYYFEKFAFDTAEEAEQALLSKWDTIVNDDYKAYN